MGSVSFYKTFSLERFFCAARAVAMLSQQRALPERATESQNAPICPA
ncbi:hypothetical protein [Pseudomonas sp. 24 E 13]|nr:hypothetical protein [Pseudomonas sp. 28 E 9]CRM19887.1 hypothetical protein [Pseudomonas sp. 44 R 15]CRM70535.1 hypothetical protein [Pseudomonas sp. 24 E 13]